MEEDRLRDMQKSFEETTRLFKEELLDTRGMAAEVALQMLLTLEGARMPGFAEIARRKFDEALGKLPPPADPKLLARAREVYLGWLDAAGESERMIRSQPGARRSFGSAIRL